LADRFSFSQWQSRVTAGIGGIAAIVAGWGIGLFESRDQPPPPTLIAGQPITAGEWALRFDRASLSDQFPDGLTVAGSGRKAIIVYLQATNRTAQTSNSFVQAIKLDTPIPGIDERPTPYLLRDHAIMAELQPALPEEMALVWTYPAGRPAPARVRFAITASNFKPFDNLYAQPGWFDPHTIGVIDLPLTAQGPSATGSVS